MKPEPLTDAEFDRLNSVLVRFGDKHSMNLEKLEWLPLGSDLRSFKAQPLLHDFLALIMRHWNVIADTLHSGEIYLPLLLEDEKGTARANDWAAGFLRGMQLCKKDWADLLNDEQHGG